MISRTQTFLKLRDLNYSVLFVPQVTITAPDGDTFVSSVYINRSALPAGVTSIKLTLSIPEKEDNAENTQLKP